MGTISKYFLPCLIVTGLCVILTSCKNMTQTHDRNSKKDQISNKEYTEHVVYPQSTEKTDVKGYIKRVVPSEGKEDQDDSSRRTDKPSHYDSADDARNRSYYQEHSRGKSEDSTGRSSGRSAQNSYDKKDEYSERSDYYDKPTRRTGQGTSGKYGDKPDFKETTQNRQPPNYYRQHQQKRSSSNNVPAPTRSYYDSVKKRKSGYSNFVRSPRKNDYSGKGSQASSTNNNR